ncbi:MAG: hypothetical protein SGARI_005002 [Bacillariaceae sp.]
MDLDDSNDNDDEYCLPSWIQEKDYSNLTPVEADKQLWEDLESVDPDILEEVYIKYASLNHLSTDNNPIYAETSCCLKLKHGGEKHPDIFIFGKPRTDICGGSRDVKLVPVAGSLKTCMNPHAIIEVVWSNNIESELNKFALQLNQHDQKFGVINVGYLIKFIPLQKNEFPTKDHPRRAICGIDVYRMEALKDGANIATEAFLFLKWRHGEDPKDTAIIFTAEELEQECDFSISLERIVEALKHLGITFQSPLNNE